jgi:UDP-N-acetylmuramate dehydrogenase
VAVTDAAAVSLAEFTTLRVGGEAREVIVAGTRAALVDAVLGVWASGENPFVLGGGSNVVIADAGIDTPVVLVRSRGIERLPSPHGSALIRIEAGEPWDDLVAVTVENGWRGLEALSGIPGTVGAAPIQNIGAYGYELADTLVRIEFLDEISGSVEVLARDDLGLDYRTSVIKQGRRGVVVSVDLELVDTVTSSTPGKSAPPFHDQLAAQIDLHGGAPTLQQVREAVLSIRRTKGMVLDPSDPDSVSAGSFFTNPLVSESFARGMPDAAPRWAVPAGAGSPERVKLSAAWMIERAGIRRGFSLPGSGAGISSKHTLAIVNRGGATAADITELARYVEERVRNEFGVTLHPEPVYVGNP